MLLISINRLKTNLFPQDNITLNYGPENWLEEEILIMGRSVVCGVVVGCQSCVHVTFEM